MQSRDTEIWSCKACKLDKPPGICFYHSEKTPSSLYGCEEMPTLNLKEFSPLDNYNQTVKVICLVESSTLFCNNKRTV